MNYVQMKLVTGEMLIGVLVDDHYDKLCVACPMQVKIHSIVHPTGKLLEQMTASPYLKLSDDLTSSFDRVHVLSVHNLNELGVNLYVNLLQEHHEFEELEVVGIAPMVAEHMEKLEEKKRDEEILENVSKAMEMVRHMTKLDDSEDTSNRTIH